MCRNFGVRCRRKMDTPYIAPYNPYKFPRRMSEHHKLLPIWDLHFLRWIKLRSIGTKTDRFVPQICLSIPSSLAQLPAHQTSSSPIWLQLKSRDGLVDAHVIGQDLEEMKAERQADDSSTQQSQVTSTNKSFLASNRPLTFEAALMSLKNFPEHKSRSGHRSPTVTP